MTHGMTVFYLLLTLVGGIAIVVNMIKIQSDESLRKDSIKREVSLQPDPARRGVIYSSDGKILATTVTECDLYLDLLDTIILEKGKPKLNAKGVPMESGIPDSCYRRYLDTVCQMLADVSSVHDTAYYRQLIDSERHKARPNRCLKVELQVPYSTWQAIRRLPGWKVGVAMRRWVKDEATGREVSRSVVRQDRVGIYGNMAENTVGYFNNNVAHTGLEKSYDSILRGQDGRYFCRRLTRGLWLPEEPDERMEVAQPTGQDKVDTVVVQRKVDGQSIVATIDTRYQDIAESSLRKALHQYGGQSGCAVLMEVETGYVLACANLVWDARRSEFMEVHEGRVAGNVAVSHSNQPGSTFKSVVLTAMLNDPEVDIDTAMLFRVGDKNFMAGHKDGWVRDDHRVTDEAGKVRDSLNVREIIEQSSNLGMAEMGWKYYRMQKRSAALRSKMMEVFPYQDLNLDVAAPSPKSKINDVGPVSDFTRLCFGYATRVTPMQIVTFYNALAADGRMVKPLFCRAIIDSKGTRRDVKPVVLNPRAFDPAKARMLKSMLVGVVNNGGTGKHLKTDTYLLAGKTGTAVSNGSYDASFAGFFPADKPKYTCFALLEGCHAYGWQAGTVVRKIADCVVAMDKDLDGSVSARLQPDSAKSLQRPVVERGRQRGVADAYRLVGLPYATADAGSEWVRYSEGNDSVAPGYVAYEPAADKVPNCHGMSVRDAVALLNARGFRVRVNGYGRVASQQPRANTVAKSGATVVLNLK